LGEEFAQRGNQQNAGGEQRTCHGNLPKSFSAELGGFISALAGANFSSFCIAARTISAERFSNAFFPLGPS
jgi:hypothetical protein